MRGATDQHSLLQLLLEGPADKVVILVRVEDHGRELSIPTAYGDLDGVGYLGGNGLGGLLNMEQRATELALVQQSRMLGATQNILRFWHVAHRPLAITALVAVVIHVVVVVSLGATWFR